jgi:hypothetical protein
MAREPHKPGAALSKLTPPELESGGIADAISKALDAKGIPVHLIRENPDGKILVIVEASLNRDPGAAAVMSQMPELINVEGKHGGFIRAQRAPHRNTTQESHE